MKLIPFKNCPKLMAKVEQGIAVQVLLDVSDFESHYQKSYLAMLGFTGKERYKFCTILSEIANMPGHYVVIGKQNQIAAGIHSDIFYLEDVELDEEWRD
jgi:hypothetical protein